MVRRGSPVRVRTRAWLANASGMSRVADEAPLDPLLPPLALAPDVEHNRRGRPSQLLGEGRRGDPLDPRDEVGARVEGLHPALEMTGHVVEPNATQPHHRLLLPPRPTLTLPARWAPAKSAGSRVSKSWAPSATSASASSSESAPSSASSACSSVGRCFVLITAS